MHRNVIRFGLIVTVAVLVAAKVAAQQEPSDAGPHLQPNAGGEAAAVKRVVDGIMQPYLAQGQRGLPRGRTWSRSPNLGAIVAVSLHGHRYFFPYGKATNAGAPFTPDTLVEIGSCTKTFTTTLFALAINRNQIVPDASAQKYTVIAINPTKDAAIFIGVNQAGAQPAAKGVEILRHLP